MNTDANNVPAVSSMRFEVGQQLFVVSYCFASKYPDNRKLYTYNPLVGVYRPGEEVLVTLEDIKFFELEITEHHRVRWEYDPVNGDAKYDGFVAVDANGCPWHNQYPRAQFGQTTTEANYHFRIRPPIPPTTPSGEKPVLYRCVELTTVLTQLELEQEMASTPRWKAAAAERMQLTIEAFEKAYPLKQLLRSQVDVEGFPMVEYTVTNKAM